MPSDPLSAFATRIDPRHRWSDLNLPDVEIAQLRRIPAELAPARVPVGQHQDRAIARGASALFTGPSASGKTLAAEAIATELKSTLLRVDVGAATAKYVGETEKNLDIAFTGAAAANAVLFFDEADSLFGKRSDAKDAGHRDRNLQTGALLQRIEAHPGIVIVSVARKQNVDDDFIRRMRFVIDFR
jgi:SpoVK/Ycf46/Vps4 family AAA+-type ATPase